MIRDMLTFYVRNTSDNSTVEFAFWNDFGTVTANVLDGETGSADSRDFVGDGAILSISDVPNVNDLSIRRIQVVLSQLHETVENMVRGHDIRLARAEYHRALFNPLTRNLVDTPVCHYIGQVAISPITTPAAGEEGGIAIDVISDTQELTRINPAKRSDETQKRRSGDRKMKYASITNSIKLAWGEEAVAGQS
ncbi:MAG: hypothetical protein ACYCZ0_01820 [Minisyncoccota bacterium]